jgi:outer membrane protein
MYALLRPSIKIVFYVSIIISFSSTNLYAQEKDKNLLPDNALKRGDLNLSSSAIQLNGEKLSNEKLVQKYNLPSITPGNAMTLEDALKFADKRNLKLEAMRAGIKDAQASLDIARGFALPTVTGKVNYIIHDHEDSVNLYAPLARPTNTPALSSYPPTVIMPKQDLTGSLEIAVPLVNLEAWHNIRVAKSAIGLSDMSLELVRQQLLLNVAEAYFSALMARKLIDLHLNTIASLDHHLAVSQALFENGEGLRIDVIRVQTDLDTAKQLLISANLSYDNARDALKVLTGADSLPEPRLSQLKEVDLEKENELVKKGLQNRYDLKLSQAKIEIGKNRLQTIYSQFLPSLSLLLKGNYIFIEPSDLGSTDRTRMFALLSLSIPIFNYSRFGNVHSKRVAISKATIEKDDTKELIALQVRKTRRDYLAALASVETSQRKSMLSQEALAIVEASFFSGESTSLELTDARRIAMQCDVDTATKQLMAQLTLLKLLYEIGENMMTIGRNGQ